MQDRADKIIKDPAVRVFLAQTARLTIVFALVFYGTDIITAFRSSPKAVNFGWEKNIPFLPIFYPVYYSVFPLYLLVAVILHNKPHEIRLLTRRMTACIALAGIVFLIFPFRNGYPPLPENEISWITKVTSVVAGRYNMLPSLHVTLTIVIIQAVWIKLRPLTAGLMFAWGIVLVGSTLLTHQHHILDVLTGVILGFSMNRFLRDRGKQEDGKYDAG